MNPTLLEFESFVGLAPRRACLVLGIAYVTYAHYRSNFRPLPGYHKRHILNLRKMNKRQLSEIIEEVTHGHQG